MFKQIKRLYYRRKAISPIVATILLIAITITAVAILYFVVIPLFKKTKLEIYITKIADSDKDSMYDKITLYLANTGTRTTNVTEIIIWTCLMEDLNKPANWNNHTGWYFAISENSIISASEITEEIIYSPEIEQIQLSIYSKTYYRLEVVYTGQKNHLITEWTLIQEQIDLSDLLVNFESFNLTAQAFDGTIDDPARAANNYKTSGGEYSLIENQIKLLPVLNESTLIPFYIGSRLVVFHSINGNLTEQPLIQEFALENVFRAKKIFLLGLTGSWGDGFNPVSWSLKITVTYTDNSKFSWTLNHRYIDDWWEYSNNYPPPSGPRYDGCLSYDKYGPGYVTYLDLGTQIDTPHSHIHTHSTRFFFDYYKYVQSITFEDPGTDASAAHLLSLTFG